MRWLSALRTVDRIRGSPMLRGRTWRTHQTTKTSEGGGLRLVSTFLTLFGFWLLLSGHYTGFLMLSGILCALGVVLFARRMGIADQEGHPVDLVVRALFSYWPWLLKEIVKSALQVSAIILNPRLPISPTMLQVQATQKTDVGRTTFANSITLTPGTISVEVGEDQVLVHALTRSAALGLADGEMDRRVSRFENSRASHV